MDQESVCRGAVYTVEEVCRRLRWEKWAFRQVRLHGLRAIRCGRRNYVLGDDVLAFFERLAEEQRPERKAADG